MGRRGRELQEVEASAGEESLGLGNIRERVGVEVVTVAAVGLEPERHTPSMRPADEAFYEALLEEGPAYGFIVLANSHGLPGRGARVERPAVATE